MTHQLTSDRNKRNSALADLDLFDLLHVTRDAYRSYLASMMKRAESEVVEQGIQGYLDADDDGFHDCLEGPREAVQDAYSEAGG